MPHFGAGLGLRAALNENFIISVDYGFSLDHRDGTSGLYIGIGNIFWEISSQGAVREQRRRQFMPAVRSSAGAGMVTKLKKAVWETYSLFYIN
ncbi:MAG: hypothetical protein MZV64_50375 [Ignavibacteriales bacterium]|nr:hypothetical protein [Ignavibacteriales bacterium]